MHLTDKRKTRSFSRITAILVLISFLLSFAACSTNKPDKAIAEADRFKSAENVARVYAEAAYIGDYDLLRSCYPDSYGTDIEGTSEALKTWSESMKSSLDEQGIVYSGTRVTETQAYSETVSDEELENAMLNIALDIDQPQSSISDITLCNVRVFCTYNDEDRYQDVILIVYKFDNRWCVFNMQGADAE